jgi:hypothetical protein
MRVSTPPETVTASGTLEARISVEGVRSLGSFQFTLGYDPASLRAEGARLGEFLGSTGRSANPLGPRIDPQAGKLTFGAFTLGQGAGPDGEGDIAVVTFTALRPGKPMLELSDVQVTDIAGIAEPIAVEGSSVEVIGAPGSGLPSGAVLAGVLVVLACSLSAFVVIRSQRRSAAEAQGRYRR